MVWTLARLEVLDRADSLAAFRDEFRLPGGLIYLDGNSLGPMPRATSARIASVLEHEWGSGLIRSWNDAGWIDLPARLGDEIATLLGAPAGSVLVADSTSVNLFKLLAAALALHPDRSVILTETGNFPTDLYVAEGLVAHLGGQHAVRRVEPDVVMSALGPEVAVLMLTHVNYRTGAMHDMAEITAAAHRTGTLVLWDLAHSAGAVPVDLASADVDFAVGCGYKFLNGGPGAPAFLFVAPRLQAEARFPISGWFGHADPFGFHDGFLPANGIGRAAVGTPSILAMAALQVGVGIASRAPMPAVRAKSLLQSNLLMELVAQECPCMELELVTPRESDRRGSQVSFRHPHAWPVMQALVEAGVIGDFRTPDILRFGITPLTLRHVDLWQAVAALREVLGTGQWRQERFQVRRRVT